MTIAALDLATTTGYASIASGIIDSGIFKCRNKLKDGWGACFVRFRDWLRDWLDVEKPEQIWYEDVKHFSSNDSAKAYCGLRAIVLIECETRCISVHPAGVSAVKKHFTGRGNATKQDMIDTAAERHKDIKIIDDNHADALGILSFAIFNNKTLK